MSKRRVELFLIDTVIILCDCALSDLLAYFNLSSVILNGTFTIWKLLFVFACIMGMRMAFSIYKNIWRYANVGVYLKLVISDAIAWVIFYLVGLIVPSLSFGFGYSAFIFMGAMLLTLTSRFIYQSYYAFWSRHSDEKLVVGSLGEGEELHKINVAIVGAGNVGATLADELIRNPGAHYNPYCFIDTDAAKIGGGINGIRVYPEDDYIIERIKSLPVQEIVIALPDASAEDKTRLYNLYSRTNCKVMLYDYPLGNERSGKKMLREFSVEDLLFRDAIPVSSEMSVRYYSEKTVLVTGGGGSIGSELCRQIAALSPKRLVILDIYENSTHEIRQELFAKYQDTLDMKIVIASVRDAKRMNEVFATYRPDIVFHAAAHKHVPLMEVNACEAVKNNVLGTYNVANMAEKYGAEKFLLVSTDKAVNPTNIMGASKRLCEMIIQCRKDSATEFTAVRFGNVLGSNGSVIPLFKKQIESGGPVTVTDREVTRFFMTIPEAVGLLIETGAMARNGELFVLDMGKPVRIWELAENMIRLSGLTPYEDINIVEIGLRPGEKLYEEILMKTENMDKTPNKLIFIERDKAYTREEVDEKIAILAKAVEIEGYEAVVDAFKRTVPTYHDADEVNARKRAEALNAEFTETAEVAQDMPL